MLQLDARSACTVMCGVSGSGKSTIAMRYAVSQAGSAAIFAFDPEGEFSQRFKLISAETPEELACALEEGFAIFDPHLLFPGDLSGAFDWFCGWTFEAASALPGRKLLLLDEAWKYCDRNTIPRSLSTCVQTGRKRGLEMVFCTQLPHKLNGAILNEVTEWVCFNLAEVKALDCVAERGVPREEVATLPMGSFFARNQRTGGVLRGRVF